MISRHFCDAVMICIAEMEMGQWVMGHGSNGSLFLSQWVTASDPLTHDEITQYQATYYCFPLRLATTLFLVDIKKLLTHSIRPIIIAGGLILIYDFCSEDRDGCPAPPCHTPLSLMRKMK